MKIFLFKKINIVLGLLILLALVSATSCKKLIEIPASPPSQISQTAIFSDSVNVMSAVAGVYSYYYNGFAFEDGSLSAYTGLSSDELSSSITYNTDIPQFYNNALRADNGGVGNIWSTIYAGVYKVNVCLNGIEGSTGISATLKQQLLGELKVVRALYYFNLVNLFGGVPLVKTTDYNITANLPQSTTDEVYAFIIADLLAAQKQLKISYPSVGRARPNLYTASALLAKVYLYKGQWQDAYNMANQVISSGLYTLEPNLNNVFLDGSNEAIWQIPANGAYNQTSDATNFVPYANYIIPNYLLTNYLIDAFEAGDQRLLNWVGINTVNINGTNQLFYYPYKYKNTTNPAATTEDFMILRVAEQYLIRAEANAHLNNLTGAMADINQVRKRAGLLNTTASQDNILTAIYNERQTELFCEWGNRWYDLKRTGKINTVLGAEKTGWQPNAALYPVPYIELRNNTKLIQNQGYN